MALLEKIRAFPLGNISAKFDLITSLMRDIFNQTPSAPYNITASGDAFFTDHGLNHSLRIIDKMELLLTNHDIDINGLEAFILSSTAWLHDVGMFLGGIEGETQMEVRAVHAERSSELVDSFLDTNTIRLDEESLIIKDIIQAHSSQYEIDDLADSTRILGNEVEIKLLGAIFKLSDTCDCDRRRAPVSIFKLYYRFIPTSSKEHWERVFPITDVNFDNTRSSIILNANLSESVFERISQYINLFYLKQEIERELSSVEKILNSNAIYLREVEIKLFNSNSFIDLNRFPFIENYCLISLKSRFKKIEELSDLLDSFVVDIEEGLNVVVEIAPPDGPIYINLEKRISLVLAQRLKDELMDQFGDDLIRTDIDTSEVISDA